MSTKQWELLKEADPDLSRVAVFQMTDKRMFGPEFWERVEAAGRAAGITVDRVPAHGPGEFDGA